MLIIFIMAEDVPPPPKRTLNKANRRNHAIFAIALIVVEIAVSVAYGFVGSVGIQTINAASVLTAVFLALLAVVGFGLYLGYYKHLIWSALAFPLMLLSCALQMYPLFNALWGKVGLHQTSDSFGNRGFTLYLAAMDGSSYHNNTVTAAIKCGLSLIVAFSSIIGRVGPLECLFLAVFGIAGYEVNRSLVGRMAQDLFGSFTIFSFGGFLGVMLGILLRVGERKRFINTYKMEGVEGSAQTVTQTLTGAIALFVLFPMLVFEGDQTFQSTAFQKYGAAVAVLLSMGSAVVTSIGLSLFVNGDRMESIRIKDVVNAQIAGAIASGAAAYYSTTPFLPLVAGAIAAVVQYFCDNYLQKKLYLKWGVVSTYSFTLYCVQGLIAAALAAGYNSRINGSSNGVVFPSNMKAPRQQIIAYFVSAGIGIGCGFFIGVLCLLVNKSRKEELFCDKTVFIPRDSIAYAPKADKKDKKSHSNTNPSISVSDGSSRIMDPPQQPVVPQITKKQQQVEAYSLQSPEEQNSFEFIDMLSVAIE